MRIELLYAPGCPLAAQARLTVQRCLDQLGLRATVNEVVAQDVPSPTVRVDGVDVMGQPAAQARSCRLDVPSDDRVLAALRGSSARGASEKDQTGNPATPRTQ